MVAIEFGKAREIHEHSLRGLRAKVSCSLSARSNCCFEHEIEFICIAKFAAAFRTFYIVLADNISQFFCAHRIGIFHNISDKMICPEGLMTLLAFCEGIRESAHVPGCDKYVLEAYCWDFYLVITLVYHKYIPPYILNAAL